MPDAAPADTPRVSGAVPVPSSVIAVPVWLATSLMGVALTGFVGLVSMTMKFGASAERLDAATARIVVIESRLGALATYEARAAVLEQRADTNRQRLDALERRTERLEERGLAPAAR